MISLSNTAIAATKGGERWKNVGGKEAGRREKSPMGPKGAPSSSLGTTNRVAGFIADSAHSSGPKTELGPLGNEAIVSCGLGGRGAVVPRQYVGLPQLRGVLLGRLPTGSCRVAGR